MVRQRVESDADIVKANPSDNVNEYNSVEEIADYNSVLVRGS